MFTKWIYDAVYKTEVQSISKNIKRRLIISGCLLIGGVTGWHFGNKKSDWEDKEKYLVQFESEDQIYNILNHERKPVFIYYFCPGEPLGIVLRKPFLNQAKLYNEKVAFIKVNCAEHYAFCRNLDFTRHPKVELILPPIRKNPPEHIEYKKDFSSLGIEAFLEENGIIRSSKPTEGLINFYNDFLNYELNKSLKSHQVTPQKLQ